MNLALRNVVFTAIMPGSVGVYIPWLILTGGGRDPEPVVWPAVVLIGLGVALYLWCLWLFATLGRGTPWSLGCAAARRRRRPVWLGPKPDVPGGVPGRGG